MQRGSINHFPSVTLAVDQSSAAKAMETSMQSKKAAMLHSSLQEDTYIHKKHELQVQRQTSNKTHQGGPSRSDHRDIEGENQDESPQAKMESELNLKQMLAKSKKQVLKPRLAAKTEAGN
jgi:hypothetical protein